MTLNIYLPHFPSQLFGAIILKISHKNSQILNGGDAYPPLRRVGV